MFPNQRLSPIQTSRNPLSQQMQLLSPQEYKSFIKAYELETSMHSYWADINEKLQAIEESSHKLEHKFKNNAEMEVIWKEQKKLEHIDRQLPKLEILLSSPDYMDVLLEENELEMAVDLFLHFQKLFQKHKFQLLSYLYHQLASRVKSKLLQKIQTQLEANLFLSSAIHLTNLLQKMNFYSNKELAMLFLKSRFSFWENSLKVQLFEGSDQQTNVLDARWVEKTRTYFLDTVTQYQTIFQDPSSLSIIYHFFDFFSQELKSTLSGYLKRQKLAFDPSLVLPSLIHLGVAWSRKGFEFRVQLSQVFLDQTVWLLELLEISARDFILDLQTCLQNQKPIFIPLQKDSLDLLDFPPVACFTNEWLKVFNYFRSLAFLDNFDGLHQTFCRVLQFLRDQLKSLLKSHSQQLLPLIKVFIEVWLPFMEKNIYDVLYGQVSRWLLTAEQSQDYETIKESFKKLLVVTL